MAGKYQNTLFLFKFSGQAIITHFHSEINQKEAVSKAYLRRLLFYYGVIYCYFRKISFSGLFVTKKRKRNNSHLNLPFS